MVFTYWFIADAYTFDVPEGPVGPVGPVGPATLLAAPVAPVRRKRRAPLTTASIDAAAAAPVAIHKQRARAASKGNASTMLEWDLGIGISRPFFPPPESSHQLINLFVLEFSRARGAWVRVPGLSLGSDG